MFDAQYLFHNAAVFSPWFPRQGDNIRVVGELIKKNTANIDVTLYHKEVESDGDGTALAGTLSLTSEGTVAAKEWTGLKDLVRYKFTATGTGASEYALFRMLSPVWFDAIS